MSLSAVHTLLKAGMSGGQKKRNIRKIILNSKHWTAEAIWG